MNTVKQERAYYLDWLRVLGMLVVFYFHCSHIFDPIDYQVKNAEKSMILFTFVTFAMFWMMPLFFWVAGAAARFSFEVKTVKEYLTERCKRLAIPFLMAVIILIPPQEYIELVEKHLFTGSFVAYLPKSPLILLSSEFTPDYFGRIGHHAWFLAFLFLFSVITVPVFRHLRQDVGRQISRRLVSVCHPKGRIYLFSIPLALIYMFLKPLSPEYCGWADFLYWLVIFILGFIFSADGRFIEIVRKNRIVSIVVGSLSLGTTIFLLATGSGLQFYQSPDYSAGSLAFQFLWAITAWSWTIFFIGLANQHLNFTNQFLTAANQAALPFYLLHQTVILLIAFYVVHLHLSIFAKFMCISTVSLALILILYEFIRRINLLRFLFGMKPKTSNPSHRNDLGVGKVFTGKP